MDMEPTTCPYCGENSLTLFQPKKSNVSFVLTTVDSDYDPPRYNKSGVPVTVMTCNECKGIYVICDSLTKG